MTPNEKGRSAPTETTLKNSQHAKYNATPPKFFAIEYDAQEYMAKMCGGHAGDYFHGKAETRKTAEKLGILEAWEAAVESNKALQSDIGKHSARSPVESQAEPVRNLELIRGDQIQPEAVEWLWDGWLAAGKTHILGGAPGTGKTTLAMAVAAIFSSGGKWPDGSQAAIGNVVIWSGEDDPSDGLVPRLRLSGADMRRVFFVGGIREGNDERSFDPARDIEALRRKMQEVGEVGLLIVDPIVSAIAGDSHKNAEVRRGLQPLVDLAGSMRCAVLGITHFSKGTAGRDPTERITGSIAFGALARVVMVAAKSQEEDGRVGRILCRAKSNIGPDDGGFAYELVPAELETHPGVSNCYVQWGQALDGGARELLAASEDDGEGGSIGDAKRFLADLLADGPVPVVSINAEANSAGFSKATIRRAKKALSLVAGKDGMHGGWYWQLPKMLNSAEDAQQNEMSTFGKSEHLRDGCEVEV